MGKGARQRKLRWVWGTSSCAAGGAQLPISWARGDENTSDLMLGYQQLRCWQRPGARFTGMGARQLGVEIGADQELRWWRRWGARFTGRGAGQGLQPQVQFARREDRVQALEQGALSGVSGGIPGAVGAGVQRLEGAGSVHQRQVLFCLPILASSICSTSQGLRLSHRTRSRLQSRCWWHGVVRTRIGREGGDTCHKETRPLEGALGG